jgi:hypothetical protein
MFKKNFLLSVGLLMLVGSATTADPFELNGPGNQIYEDELVGDEQVKPGGVITATISNNWPGYQRFFIYIAGPDANGNEVLLWGTFIGGTNCRPGTTCVFDVPNVPQLGITADELALVGYFGRNGSRASVTHVTNNP